MKRLLFFLLCTPTPCVFAQSVNPAPKVESAAQRQTRTEIQKATDSFNAALKRGDAEGALKWLAPDFELGVREYRVRDLAWMKRALPLQLKRGHYTALSVKVQGVELDGDIARTSERINAEQELNRGVIETNSVRAFGTQGVGASQWRLTTNGWRLRRGNDTLDVLLRLAAPDAPLRAQPASIDPDSIAAAVGLPLQEPTVVVERGGDKFEKALAFSPDGRELAFYYDEGTMHFVLSQSGALSRKTPDQASTMRFTRDGNLWTTDRSSRVRRWDSLGAKVQKEWKVAQRSFYRASVAPDGQAFAVSEGNEVRLWNTRDNGPHTTFKPEIGGNIEVELSPDATKLAVFTWGAVEVRQARDGALLFSFKDEKWGGFLPDGKTMATWKWGFFSSIERPRKNDRNVLRFRSLATGEIERELVVPAPRSQMQEKLQQAMEANGTVRVPGFFTLPRPVISPDGSVAANVEFDGSIGVWNTKTGKVFRILRGFSAAQNPNEPDLVFSPDGTQLAVSTNAGEIGVWDVTMPE